MVRAWEIAKEGVKKFGGKVKEYFAMALKLAWKEAKRIAANEVGAIQLMGSEKQIKWAEDIREVVVENIDSVFAVLDKSFEENKKEMSEKKLVRAQNTLEELKKIATDFIANENNAASWIDKFKAVTRERNIKRAIFEALQNELHEQFDIRAIRAVDMIMTTADIKFLKGEF